MKTDHKKIALQRIYILLNEAAKNAKQNQDLAQRQADIAKRLATKYRVNLPYEIKMHFCKKCKSFIAPAVNSKIRLGRSKIKSVRITCQFCNHTYRKIIKSK